MVGILDIQFEPVIGNKKRNLEIVEDFISKNSEKSLDLVVLPEFFSTGINHEVFVNSPEDDKGGNVIKEVQKWAVKYNVNIIAGTIIESVGGKLYNTSFAIGRSGNILAKYRKIHLYNYLGGTEGDRITAGKEPVVVDFDFGKVGIGICYDIRYPMHYKKLVQMGAEIIVLPTAWVVPSDIYEDIHALKYAKDMWVALNRTRAFDNMVYCVCSNQIGRISDKISAIGSSMIISPTAEVLSSCHAKKSAALYAEIDLELVKALKSVYPIAFID